jgi:hypothetical protein
MNWYAIYIKPNYEDSTTLQLRNAGIEVLNPKIKIKSVRGNTPCHRALFPSYLFARFNCQRHGHMIKYNWGQIHRRQAEPLVVPKAIMRRYRKGCR